MRTQAQVGRRKTYVLLQIHEVETQRAFHTWRRGHDAVMDV